jgi:hypothetical protein
MSKGYTVIEPRSLNDLIVLPKHRVFAVAIVSWVIYELSTELKEFLAEADTELEVICVTYMGSYPAIGAHSPSSSDVDVRTVVEEAVDRLLSSASTDRLMRFITNSGESWGSVTQRLFGHAEPSDTGEPAN